jgi:nucleoid DNA-binding protein
MNKIDLIQALKESNHLSRSEAEKIVTKFFNKIAEKAPKGNELKSGVFVPFPLKNIGHVPGETPKPVRRLRSHQRNCCFSRRERN